MRPTLSVLVALLVVLAAIAVAPAGALAQDDTDDSGDGDDVAPGEHLSGALAVQEAEFEGEMADRTYGVKVAKAASDDAKADVVGEQLQDVETRLNELEERANELERQRASGEITEGEYRAKMSKVEAERRTAQRLAERSNETAGELPADALAEKGIDAAAIQTLMERAANLTGPDVAEIARSIAGPNVGLGAPGDRPDTVPDDVGPGADRGAQQPGEDTTDADANDTDGPAQNSEPRTDY